MATDAAGSVLSSGAGQGSAMMAGSMFGPWGMAAGAAVDIARGSTGGPAGPSEAIQSNKYAFDNSGWTVATGGSNASGDSSLPSWAMPALAAFGLLLWFKKKN